MAWLERTCDELFHHLVDPGPDPQHPRASSATAGCSESTSAVVVMTPIMHMLLAYRQQEIFLAFIADDGRYDVPEAKGPRFQRLEPALRRQSILDAATRLFSTQPYEDVSVAAIASYAGVARGLVNHYFGTKRRLYLEVVENAATVPPAAVAALPIGDVDTRISAAVDWFLDALAASGGRWLAANGSPGLSRDTDLEQILSAAEDTSVDRVIEAVGLADRDDPQKLRALIRPYGQLARAAGREWLLKNTLTRIEAHRLLADTLSTIVRDVYPTVLPG